MFRALTHNKKVYLNVLIQTYTYFFFFPKLESIFIPIYDEKKIKKP